MPGNSQCFPGERGENLLGDILRKLDISSHASQGCRVNTIEVPPNNFGKRDLIAICDVAVKQFGVIRHGLFYGIRRRKNRTSKRGPLSRFLKSLVCEAMGTLTGRVVPEG